MKLNFSGSECRYQVLIICLHEINSPHMHTVSLSWMPQTSISELILLKFKRLAWGKQSEIPKSKQQWLPDPNFS